MGLPFWSCRKKQKNRIEPIVEEPSVNLPMFHLGKELFAEEVVEHLEPIVEQVISPESAVNVEPVLDTPVD